MKDAHKDTRWIIDLAQWQKAIESAGKVLNKKAKEIRENIEMFRKNY